MFAVAVAVPLSVAAVKLGGISPLGRHTESEEDAVDPAATRVDQLMASSQQREGRRWSSELKARLDHPLGQEPTEDPPERTPSLQRGVVAPAMLLLVRRWLNIQ